MPFSDPEKQKEAKRRSYAKRLASEPGFRESELARKLEYQRTHGKPVMQAAWKRYNRKRSGRLIREFNLDIAAQARAFSAYVASAKERGLRPVVKGSDHHVTVSVDKSPKKSIARTR